MAVDQHGAARRDVDVSRPQHVGRENRKDCAEIELVRFAPCAFGLTVSHSVFSQGMVYADIDRNPDCDPETSREFGATGVALAIYSSWQLEARLFLYVLRRQACHDARVR